MDIFTMITSKMELVWEFHSFSKYDVEENIIKIFLSGLTSRD